IAMGEEVLAGGDGPRALGIFSQLKAMAPEHPEVLAGLIRAHLAAGDVAAAQAEADALTPEQLNDSHVTRALAALDLAHNAAPGVDLAPLRAAVEANPNDHQARIDLANALMAAGDREGAVDQLLASIAAERDWNEGTARGQLLKIFEAVGISDPWVAAQRRRLSAVLFT
ncbi:MAG: tetratricopeptide repeat protein, partial [Alphaproteobacteria bacterium]|nr:tetratricopeptide repeat protein [Alphaproteobacteria bacterium]